MIVLASGCSSPRVQPNQSTYEIVQGNADYSVFVAAMHQSGLWDSIQQEEQITLLIPDNAALENEGSRFLLETVLVAEGNEQRLLDVLSHHILPGKFNPAKDTKGPSVLRTYNGGCIDFDTSSKQLGLGSTIVESIETGNMIIHRVDRIVSKRWDDDGVCNQFS